MSKSDRYVRQLYKNLRGPVGLVKLEDEYSRPEKVVPLIEKLVGKRRQVLDLCCGYGRIGIPLSLRGYEVEGLDIRKDMIRQGRLLGRRAKSSMSFRHGDMRRLPYPDAYFDAIICLWNSFNHLLLRSEQVKTLKEAYRVLRPGGKAIFETMDGESGPAAARNSPTFPIYRTFLLPGTEMVFFVHTRERFQQLCKAAGIPRCKTYYKFFDGRKKLLLEVQKA